MRDSTSTPHTASNAAPTPTCLEIRDGVRAGTLRAIDVVEASLAAIEERDRELHAFHEVYADEARAAANAIDARVAAGDDPGPLAGVPVAIKDNIVLTEGTTTCGSRILANYRSPFDASVVEKLRAAGAIVIGHTNCDEFAMGSSTETCTWGPTRNPHDPTRVPGGSSGGSAVAVASGMVPAALGSDTGGSIRQPAAFTGCVGLKPTYGRVSRYGLIAFGSSLDQIGPFTRTVDDAALLLDVISGVDPLDSTSADVAAPAVLPTVDEPLDSLRVGIPREYLSDRNDPAVDAMVADAVERLRALGATVVDVELPLTDHGISTYYVIAPAEASSNLARYDGIRYGHRAELAPGDDLETLFAKTRAEGFGAEVQRRIMLGTYVLSAGYYDAYYKRALQVRRLIKEEFDRAFESCDVLLGPTAPTPAFKIGAGLDPWQMYLCDVYTVNANIAGICGVSIPGGTTEVDGHALPIGLQLQAPDFAERTLLRAARMLESAPTRNA